MKQLIKSCQLLAFCFLLWSKDASSQSNITDSIMSGGIWRAYLLYVPAVYSPAKAVPLILNLHGLSSDMQQQEAYGDFRPIADTADFILVHPNGTVGSNGRGWNNFGALGTGVDDVGFLSALIDTLEKKYNLNPNRIYSTGMSNGGFMSYDLACFLNSRIAAIASVTGSMMSNHLSACNAVHATPVMEVHGTADPVVSYTGVGGIIASEDIDSLVKYWVTYNHCNPVPVITQVPNTDPTDGCDAEHHVFSNGSKGSSVELYKITGGGHAWPGAPVNLSYGPTNHDFSASKEIWRFFSQYHLDNLQTGINEPVAGKLAVSISPNPARDGMDISINDEGPEPGSIQLLNCLGMEVRNERLSSPSIHLERGNLSSGIYLLVVSKGSIQVTRKVVFD